MLKNLRQLRKSAGITQKQLADAIGISQQSVNKYENHKIEPDIDTLIRIADFFETSVDYLIGHTEIRHKIENTQEFELNQQEAIFLNNYRKLSAKQRVSLSCIMEIYTE